MTPPDLADAIAAQRTAYAPQHVPPFNVLVERRRRHDRRQRVVLTCATVLAVAASLSVATPLLDRSDTVSGGVAGDVQATEPDERRLRAAFDATSGTAFFADVQSIPAGEYELAGRPRRAAEGVQAETSDKTTSVSWTIIAPPLTDAEVLSMAGTVSGSAGTEAGRPVPSDADQSGPVRSVAFRFGDGSFLGIRAWSDDGGMVSLTSGNGATVTDEQIRAWEAAMRALLIS